MGPQRHPDLVCLSPFVSLVITPTLYLVECAQGIRVIGNDACQVMESKDNGQSTQSYIHRLLYNTAK